MKNYLKELRSNIRDTISLWIGLRRLAWNRCPSCNSDGPAIDNCSTCQNNREYKKDKAYLTYAYIYSYTHSNRGFRRYK